MAFRNRVIDSGKVFVVTLSGVFCAVELLEFAARMLFPDLVGDKIALRLTKERPTWATPSAEFHHVDEGAYRLNFPDNSAGSTTRIMIVGDSFVEGHGVAEQERFGHLLQQDLGPTTPVAILGTTSYSPVIYRNVVQKAFSLAPYRAVAVFVDQTDPVDDLIYEEDLIHDGPPWRFNVERIIDRQKVLANVYDDMLSRFSGSWNPRNLAAVNLLLPLSPEDYFNPNEKYYTYVKFSLERAKFIGQFNDHADSVESRRMLALLTSHLDQIAAECRARGTPLFLVANPWEFQSSKYPRITLGLPGPFPKENRLEGILMERYGTLTGVHVIPMTRYFRESEDPSSLFISMPGHEVHWNASGHALAERVLKRHMMDAIPDLARAQ